MRITHTRLDMYINEGSDIRGLSHQKDVYILV